MPWLGYCRNGRVNIIPVENVDRIREGMRFQQDSRRWSNEARLIDEREWMIWLVGPNGDWFGDTLDRHMDDPVVSAALSRSRAWPSVDVVRSPERKAVKPVVAPVGAGVSGHDVYSGGSNGDGEHRERGFSSGTGRVTTVDNRDWTRSRPRRRNRR